MMVDFPNQGASFDTKVIELKSGLLFKSILVFKEKGSGKCFIRDEITSSKTLCWIPIPKYLYNALVKYEDESSEMAAKKAYYFDYDTEWSKWL